jgi:uncharacterized protein YodC (DUF2158 family)
MTTATTFAVGDRVRVKKGSEELLTRAYIDDRVVAGNTGVIVSSYSNESTGRARWMVSFDHYSAQHLWFFEDGLERVGKIEPGMQVQVALDEEKLDSVFLTSRDIPTPPAGEVVEKVPDDSFVNVTEPVWRVKFENVKWSLPESILTPVETELEKYKKKVVAVVQRVFDDHLLMDHDDLKKVVDDLDLHGLGFLETEKEPSPGSIARDLDLSTVFVRPWARAVDGNANWRKTGTADTFRWSQIKDRVVVLLDTEGADEYDNTTSAK